MDNFYSCGKYAGKRTRFSKFSILSRLLDLAISIEMFLKCCMLFKDFLFQNLYYFITGCALLSALGTYLYFYNREVLSFRVGDSGGALEIESSNSTDSEETTTDSPLTENVGRRKDSIIVDLSGAVDRPGIYSLRPGDRLADLISLSGGVTNQASQKWLSRNLNLSKVLQDQQKVYIPFEWEISPEKPDYSLKELVVDKKSGISENFEGGGEPRPVAVNTDPDEDVSTGVDWGEDSVGSNDDSEDSTGLINLNQASEKKLMELPGVGEVTAGKIIDNRPYASLEDLDEKTDIYQSTLEKIKDLVTF